MANLFIKERDWLKSCFCQGNNSGGVKKLHHCKICITGNTVQNSYQKQALNDRLRIISVAVACLCAVVCNVLKRCVSSMTNVCRTDGAPRADGARRQPAPQLSLWVVLRGAQRRHFGCGHVRLTASPVSFFRFFFSRRTEMPCGAVWSRGSATCGYIRRASQQIRC